MATYTSTAVGSQRAKKAEGKKAVIGIKLSYNTKTGKLSARVGSGRLIPLYETSNGLVSFAAKDFSDYESHSEAKLSRDLISDQKYLQAKYCITQRSFAFLRDLALVGKCLLTKAEERALAQQTAQATA